MKLNEYIKTLQDIQSKYGDLDLVYSRDDEGNGFDTVGHSPCVGTFDGEDFSHLEDDEDDEENSKNIVVCIN